MPEWRNLMSFGTSHLERWSGSSKSSRFSDTDARAVIRPLRTRLSEHVPMGGRKIDMNVAVMS